jgi:hypothetical protein
VPMLVLLLPPYAAFISIVYDPVADDKGFYLDI